MGHERILKPRQKPLESTCVLEWDMGIIRRFYTQEMDFGIL
jgi:hypothetical protein